METNIHEVILSLEKSTTFNLGITWSNLTRVTGFMLSSTLVRLIAFVRKTEMLLPVPRITSKEGRFLSESIESNLLNRISMLTRESSWLKKYGRSLESRLAASWRSSKFVRLDNDSEIVEMLLYDKSRRLSPLIFVIGSGMFLMRFDDKFRLFRLCSSEKYEGSVEIRLQAKFNVVKEVICEISGGISLI
ncbi:hypothetical protein OGAPHI_006290 [Ogataea philodendri]|uniref:Uncharacterized protein n=1 Tax=Ogataea philodendri TaxID=1378263 RepID=A0A9P8NZ33_9ASCO|nr:uncharacterized protein OGAPHI_006290 [Ogataea philodendri]KAH3662109.1 hypothetical protein OGAPHI_006290 [Ogataea philodendri]